MQLYCAIAQATLPMISTGSTRKYPDMTEKLLTVIQSIHRGFKLCFLSDISPRETYYMR